MPDINKMIVAGNLYYTMNVWDVLMQSSVNDDLIAYASALSESAVNITREQVEKNGGPKNLVQFIINAKTDLAVTMGAIDFDEKKFALSVGSKITLGEHTVSGEHESCKVTTESGKRYIAITKTPVSKKVFVKNGDVPIPVVIGADPTKIDVTLITNENDDCLEVHYDSLTLSKRLTIGGSGNPGVVKLVMTKDLFRGDGVIVGKVVFVIPRFQFDGNVDFAGALGDSDTFNMSGKALEAETSGCESNESGLGYMDIVMNDGNYNIRSISVQDEYDVAVGSMNNIDVYADLGADDIYNICPITDKCKYTSSDPTIVEVDENTGEIIGESVGTATITIEYGDKIATTEVTVA